MIAQRHDFANRQELAATLATTLARKLSAAVTRVGKATLAVSGGTTPVLMFQHLARQSITWEKVTITLVDERQVPQDNARSNARLVRENLMVGEVARARFVPLFKNPAASGLPPFDALVLGMGNDGHTASYFPGGDTLAQAIDPHTDKSLIEITAPGSGEPRITFTLPAILSSGFLALHIEGREKQDVLDRAFSGTDAMAMPIRSVLNSLAPIHVYWCP